MNPRSGAIATAMAAMLLSISGAAVAHGPKGCKHGILRGQYVFSATGFTRTNLDSPWVPKAIVEFIDFNGDGTLTTPSVSVANPAGNTGLILDRAPGSAGSYSINDDCTGNLQFADGNVFKLYVAPRGDEIWMLQTQGLGGSLNVFQGKAERLW